jgi:hypothetical protein
MEASSAGESVARQARHQKPAATVDGFSRILGADLVSSTRHRSNAISFDYDLAPTRNVVLAVPYLNVPEEIGRHGLPPNGRYSAVRKDRPGGANVGVRG